MLKVSFISFFGRKISGLYLEIAHQAKFVSLKRPEKPLRDVMTSSGRPHVVLNVTSRDVEGRIRSGTSLGRTQDVHKLCFHEIFYFPDSISMSDILLQK